MLVVFANNQAIIANASTTTVITTDPVALNGNNRAYGITNVHSIFNASATGLQWKLQVSNDGQTFIDSGMTSAAIVAAGASDEGPFALGGAYARLEISFEASGAGIGAAMFDVHMNFDRI